MHSLHRSTWMNDGAVNSDYIYIRLKLQILTWSPRCDGGIQTFRGCFPPHTHWDTRANTPKQKHHDRFFLNLTFSQRDLTRDALVWRRSWLRSQRTWKSLIFTARRLNSQLTLWFLLIPVVYNVTAWALSMYCTHTQTRTHTIKDPPQEDGSTINLRRSNLHCRFMYTQVNLPSLHTHLPHHFRGPDVTARCQQFIASIGFHEWLSNEIRIRDKTVNITINLRVDWHDTQLHFLMAYWLIALIKWRQTLKWKHTCSIKPLWSFFLSVDANTLWNT